MTLPLARLSQNCSPHTAFLGGLGDVAPQSVSAPLLATAASGWLSAPQVLPLQACFPCLEDSPGIHLSLISVHRLPCKSPCPLWRKSPPPPHCARLSCLLCFLYTAAVVQVTVLLSVSICFHQECKTSQDTEACLSYKAGGAPGYQQPFSHSSLCPPSASSGISAEASFFHSLQPHIVDI